MSKLFVGGLSWNTTDDSLYDHFAQHGQVSEATVIKDRETGKFFFYALCYVSVV